MQDKGNFSWGSFGGNDLTDSLWQPLMVSHTHRPYRCRWLDSATKDGRSMQQVNLRRGCFRRQPVTEQLQIFFCCMGSNVDKGISLFLTRSSINPSLEEKHKGWSIWVGTQFFRTRSPKEIKNQTLCYSKNAWVQLVLLHFIGFWAFSNRLSKAAVWCLSFDPAIKR